MYDARAKGPIKMTSLREYGIIKFKEVSAESHKILIIREEFNIETPSLEEIVYNKLLFFFDVDTPSTLEFVELLKNNDIVLTTGYIRAYIQNVQIEETRVSIECMILDDPLALNYYVNYKYCSYCSFNTLESLFANGKVCRIGLDVLGNDILPWL